MLKKLAIALLCFTFAVVGFYNLSSAAAWPDALLKEVEALKAAAKEKKDMPASIAGANNITGDEIKKWTDEKKKFVIMDNRGKEYEKEHIAGAVSFSIDDLLKDPKIADKYSKDEILVQYCNGVKCWKSPATVLLLKHLGFKNIYWYRNGIPDWIKKDYPTVEGKK